MASRRPGINALVGSTVALVLVSGLVASPAARASSHLLTATVTDANEYATDVRHDPWDYDQPTDLIDDGRPVSFDATFGEAGGISHVDGTIGFLGMHDFYVSPMLMTVPHGGDDPGALSDHRDGLTLPLDADRYTKLSLRVFSTEASVARLEWFSCQEYTDDCRGGMRLDLQKGWNTFMGPIERTESFGLPQEWQGDILGLRLASTSQTVPTRLRLDWLRIHEPGELIDIPSEEGQFRYDSDNQLGNNNDMDETVPAHGEYPDGTTIDTGAFPPGTWWFYEGSSVYSARIDVRSRPTPEVLQPDRAGGEDFATAVLGNPWDFSDSGDVLAVRNSVNVGFSGGRLHGTNPDGNNDPYVVLPTGDDGIDAVHYHRVTVTQDYEGPFNLDDSSGGGRGGTHGRLVWRTPAHPGNLCRVDAYSDGREFVFYTPWNTYTYDMLDVSHDPEFRSTAEPNLGVVQNPACADQPVEPDPTWGTGAPITYLRFDPHEAPSPYPWSIDELRIAADDAAEPTFDITWRDPNHESGTTVTVVLDDDRDGYDGEVLFSGAQSSGINTVAFDATDRLPGTYWVHVTSRTPDGRQGRDYGTGPLQVSPRIAGADRVETAVELSRQTWDAAGAAVLASATDFPDALASVQLADALGGPLLLTPSSRVDARVIDELNRLGVTRVVVAGGPAAVDSKVVDGLRDAGYEVSRIGGDDRYETAALLAADAVARNGGTPQQAILAVGTAFPDALAAGPLSGHGDLPLLLSHPTRVEDVTTAALQDLGVDEVIVVGGEGALPRDTVDAVVGDLPQTRIAGKDRYATAALLAEAAADVGGSPRDVLIATGVGYADALAAGPAAVARGGVLLLTSRSRVPDPTAAALGDVDVDDLRSWRVVGGRAAVDHATVRGLRAHSGL